MPTNVMQEWDLAESRMGVLLKEMITALAHSNPTPSTPEEAAVLKVQEKSATLLLDSYALLIAAKELEKMVVEYYATAG